MNCKWRVSAFRLTVSSTRVLEIQFQIHTSKWTQHWTCISMSLQIARSDEQVAELKIGKSQINNLFSQQWASDFWHRDNFNRVTEFKCYKLFELSNFCDLINNPDKFLEHSFDRYMRLTPRIFNKSSIISFERYEFLIISSMHSGMFFWRCTI